MVRYSRSIAALAALFIMMGMSAPVHASETVGNKSLIEMLEDKGVLSRDEAKGLLKKDKKHLLKIGGRLQVQYKHVNDGTPTANNTSELLVRRARFTFQAQVTPWGYLKVQPEFGKGKVTLKDAYFALTPPQLSGFELDIGNQYPGFSREALNSSKYLHFVERTATSQFAPFRQLGINWHQHLMQNKLHFQLGVFNGAINTGAFAGPGQLKKRQIYHIDLSGFGGSAGQPSSPMYASRIDFSPFGKFRKTQADLKSSGYHLEVGANYYTQNLGSVFAAANNGLDSSSAWGVDFGFRGLGLSVEGEYILRTLGFDATNLTTGARDVDQTAYVLQAGYMVMADKLEIAARFETLDFDDRNVYLGTKGEDELRVYTVGVNWFLKGHHMKIQANYVINRESMPGGAPEPDNDEFLMQFAYYF